MLRMADDHPLGHGARGIGALLLIATLMAPLPAAADSAVPPAMPDGGLPASVIDARTRFIEERLEARRRHGRIWYWGWMTVNAGSAVGLGIAAGLADDQDDIVNNAVSAGIATMGVADLVFRPLEARLGSAPIADLPEGTLDEKRAKLAAAERLLKANAERAEERTSLSMHAANLGVATASGLIVGLLGNSRDAAISSAANFLGGIAYLLTQPAGPAEDWRAYQRMVAGDAAAPPLSLQLRPLDGGAGLRLAVAW